MTVSLLLYSVCKISECRFFSYLVKNVFPKKLPCAGGQELFVQLTKPFAKHQFLGSAVLRADWHRHTHGETNSGLCTAVNKFPQIDNEQMDPG